MTILIKFIPLRAFISLCRPNHVIGPHGKDSALRKWGLSLCARGGSHALRGALVTVARKLVPGETRTMSPLLAALMLAEYWAGLVGGDGGSSSALKPFT
jgi:hypothetical protein